MRRVVFHKKSERLLRLFPFLDHGYTPASDDGLVVCGEAARVSFIGDHHLIVVDAEADIRLFLQDVVLQSCFGTVEIESQGSTDSIVVRFHSWIFIQSEESSDANSEQFKEVDDEAMYKNPYEI